VVKLPPKSAIGWTLRGRFYSCPTTLSDKEIKLNGHPAPVGSQIVETKLRTKRNKKRKLVTLKVKNFQVISLIDGDRCFNDWGRHQADRDKISQNSTQGKKKTPPRK
jgi:hypothetical protein